MLFDCQEAVAAAAGAALASGMLGSKGKAAATALGLGAGHKAGGGGGAAGGGGGAAAGRKQVKSEIYSMKYF